MSEQTNILTELSSDKNFTMEEILGFEIDERKAKKIDRNKLWVPAYEPERANEEGYNQWLYKSRMEVINYLKRFKKRKRKEPHLPRKLKKGFNNSHWTKKAMTKKRRWLETKQVKYEDDFTEEDIQDLKAIHKRYDKSYPMTKWVKRALIVVPRLYMSSIENAIGRLDKAMKCMDENK